MTMREPIHPRPRRHAAVALLESARLPFADLADAHMEHFFYCGPADAPTGLVGVELCGNDALLRSLVVSAERRDRGLGTALAAHAEHYARSRGIRAVYLLTTTAEDFFKRNGYATADRASVPPGIRATREFADICPASSALLVKLLS